MNSRNYPALFLAVFVFACLAVFADSALASTANAGGSSLPGVQPLQQIRDFITGPFAYTLSVLSLVAAGAALAFGNEIGAFIRTLLYLACVISFIVFAVNFLNSLFSGALIPDYLV